MHNLVTIDGRGQAGDGCVWFPDLLEDQLIPSEPTVRRRGERIRISCELARAYLPQLGVRRHTRTVTVEADGSLRGEDIVELVHEAAIGWHWHTRARVTAEAAGWTLRGPGCRARLELEPAAGTQLRMGPEQFVAAYPHEGTVGTALSAVRVARQTVYRWALRFAD
ncbi:MAG: heparinase II/III domain-containing protein [Cephaloticoccus sp.]